MKQRTMVRWLHTISWHIIPFSLVSPPWSLVPAGGTPRELCLSFHSMAESLDHGKVHDLDSHCLGAKQSAGHLASLSATFS
jgi:hypothetical protein